MPPEAAGEDNQYRIDLKSSYQHCEREDPLPYSGNKCKIVSRADIPEAGSDVTDTGGRCSYCSKKIETDDRHKYRYKHKKAYV